MGRPGLLCGKRRVAPMPYVEKRAPRALKVGPAGEEGRRRLRSLSAFFAAGERLKRGGRRASKSICGRSESLSIEGDLFLALFDALSSFSVSGLVPSLLQVG